MPSRRTISEEEIEDGLNVVARLIDRYGDVYWPVFERLERELEQRRSRSARVKSRLNREQYQIQNVDILSQ
ncbi:hypothetical protein PB2503_03552 [Parvularcula bermudensis HTCC2503]|uniref:Uncharacterized protein n=1 Tax=Parvularcula bermudensis (strain ATCC BAA-594 / HTCC2503 / KCTC 12087) TaxID=314260 RepID=E0TDN0_PARBH|nr:hypothetical protein PB2503_03552 [Parvularcula bermudensis HTCC2503]